MIRRNIFFILAALSIHSAPALSQINNPAYADYFLVGRFGEICTMCEAIVLCEAGDQATLYENIPEEGNFTLYHLQTRTFWSQVSTIWEWFISNFNSDSLASGHSRPVQVYKVDHTHWSGPHTLEAHISLDPATIVIGDATIDRVARRWLEKGSLQPIGFCQRLPLWEALDTIHLHPAEDNES
ncbi:MAG: hypothetical protein E2O53_12370 [Gammaproteobacteria bacterium]|nr:MAG: hypothetical protein E2O53_12370 [Gammaproteobacteria bacterium]